MARISINPIKSLELEFADGTIKEALFNTECFVIYSDEFGALTEGTLNKLKNKPYELISKFLYCGMKVLDKDITLDEAKVIAVGGGEPLAAEILNCIVENFMATADEESKKKFVVEMKKVNKALLS